MAYNIGDEVVCRVDESEEEDRSYTKDVKLQIIGIGNGLESALLLCYVPQYISVRSSFVLTKHHMKQYGFDPKFLGEYAALVTKSHVVNHEPAVPAIKCTNCETLVHYANATKGEEYVCRACRDNPWR